MAREPAHLQRKIAVLNVDFAYLRSDAPGQSQHAPVRSELDALTQEAEQEPAVVVPPSLRP